MRGKTEEGYPGAMTKNLTGQKPRLHADGCQLVDRRLRNHTAISKEENPLVAVISPRQLNDE